MLAAGSSCKQKRAFSLLIHLPESLFALQSEHSNARTGLLSPLSFLHQVWLRPATSAAMANVSGDGVVAPGISALRSLVDASSVAVLASTHVEPADTMREERARATINSDALAVYMNGGQAKLDRK